MSAQGPLGATETGSLTVPVGTTPSRARVTSRAAGVRIGLPALRTRAGVLGLCGLLATTLLAAVAAAHTNQLLPESVRPVPSWLAGPFGSTGFGLDSGVADRGTGLDVRLLSWLPWVARRGCPHV